jgi:D-alanyl-D-alanine carboxypeptidase
MKNFFYVVFGGLALMALVFGISYAGTIALKKGPSIIAAVGASVSGPATDGTVISGFHRTIRYTASQEEDLIDAAAGALPSGTAKNVTAKAYILKDLTTGSTVAGHNADQLNPIASLTKLVTAVIARRLIPDASRITITKSIMATYGNTADFTAGETFTASDLLYPLLIVSSNDAAEAYAQFYGRSAFIRAMNDFTQSIGAYRTSFADPSGLDPENVSTPNDMVIIIDWIRKNDPTILDTTAIHAKTIRSHTWINPTHFLSWSYYIGGKNGYLPEADRTTASLFTLGPNKDIYAAVVLGSDNRDADVIKLLEKVPK